MSDNASVVIAHDVLTEMASALLEAGGYSAQDALMTAQSLVLANLKGHDSHGVVRVAEYLHGLKKGVLSSPARFEVISETENSLYADAHSGLGQVQMPRLLDKLLEKASSQAVISGTLKDCGHIGRLGEWVEKIAAAGCAGFVLANDNGAFRAVAPPGGKERVTSTNPLAFGVPRSGTSGDFIFDMSTSAAAIGKMRLLRMAGEEAASGLIQDSQGADTTAPDVLFEEPKGALRVMGGAQAYKGFGLSMIVDFLSAGLSGGLTPPAPEGTAVLNNVLVTIWNPVYFAGLEHFRAQAEKYTSYLYESDPIDPQAPIRLPGERSASTEKERRENGITLSAATMAVLWRSAEIVGIDLPEEYK